jgi:uncharacterized repeat protein (TIGR01451 family)
MIKAAKMSSFCWLLSLMALVAHGAVHAAPPSTPAGANVQARITVLNVTPGVKPQDPKPTPATQVDPGDELLYSVLYQNVGKANAQKLVAELPIPKGTAFTGQYSGSSTLMASTDGKVFEAYPIKRRVRTPEGAVKESSVPLEDYRALRWPERDLDSGQSWRTSARVRVVMAAPR